VHGIALKTAALIQNCVFSAWLGDLHLGRLKTRKR
jgi:hypothetical protein